MTIGHDRNKTERAARCNELIEITKVLSVDMIHLSKFIAKCKAAGLNPNGLLPGYAGLTFFGDSLRDIRFNRFVECWIEKGIINVRLYKRYEETPQITRFTMKQASEAVGLLASLLE